MQLLFSIHGLYWPCDSDNDCNATVGAFCLNKVCQCAVGYVFSEDITTCIKESLYGQACVASSQCSHMLTGSKCTGGVCECVEGYNYIRGRCRQLVDLHSPCTQDTDCFFGYDRDSVICKDNRCECSEDFYERFENLCRRKSMNVGDPCMVHEDCRSDDFECKNLICALTATPESNNENRRLSREIGVQTSIDVIETKDVSTSIDKSSLVIPPQDAKKVQGRQFGDNCVTENAPCEGFTHSICLQGACQCRKGYYLINGLCKAEVGEVADSAEFCEGAETFYDATTRKCSCRRNYFALNHLRSCIKPTDGLGNSCTEQSQCSPFGAAFCPGLDQRRLCTCHTYAVYDAKSQLCVPKTGLGSLCRPTSDDCSTREANTVCTNNNLCSCKDKFIEVDGKCKPGENVDCTQDSDCAMKNSECINDNNEINKNVCKCKKGFLFIKDDCLKEANEYNEECTENEQCKPLLGDLGKCINLTCTCEQHLQYNKGKCYEKKALGEKCTRSSECFVTAEPENIECRNAVCECPFGTQKDVERQVCIRPAAKKNSSDRPSVLKVITLLLTTATILITTAAIKEAYY
ncbi:hypothetical protein Bhyg_11339 [Pseudolycoriella hygida]|uniref:EGF-like domain-containing protein n=1 Tax=Pseudolycoriella hygida TaxID=35572 RepID=A0A9Q0MV56_9DIPT|nr:hypothetical protein Bhyg_11339 [Pseudolycoriella hygida]